MSAEIIELGHPKRTSTTTRLASVRLCKNLFGQIPPAVERHG